MRHSISYKIYQLSRYTFARTARLTSALASVIELPAKPGGLNWWVQGNALIDSVRPLFAQF
jgi:hypothetical protein